MTCRLAPAPNTAMQFDSTSPRHPLQLLPPYTVLGLGLLLLLLLLLLGPYLMLAAAALQSSRQAGHMQSSSCHSTAVFPPLNGSAIMATSTEPCRCDCGPDGACSGYACTLHPHGSLGGSAARVQLEHLAQAVLGAVTRQPLTPTRTGDLAVSSTAVHWQLHQVAAAALLPQCLGRWLHTQQYPTPATRLQRDACLWGPCVGGCGAHLEERRRARFSCGA